MLDLISPTSPRYRRPARLLHWIMATIVIQDWLFNLHKTLGIVVLALIIARLAYRPIAEIDAPELLELFRKIEGRGVHEMARRLRQTVGQIFRYAIVTGRARHDPAADLKGALKAPAKARHRIALPQAELPTFLKKLEQYDGEPRTRLALHLLILTFVRTGELRPAQWNEFEKLDGNEPLWRIPADRMKMGREHLVPLAPQAVAILNELRKLAGRSPLVFPSPRWRASCPTTRCSTPSTGSAIIVGRRCTGSAASLPPG